MELKHTKSLNITLRVERLNRTFMELKRDNKSILAGITGKFESHLYGIETNQRCKGEKLSGQFESHLYGIETSDCARLDVLQACLNRTFMELKHITARVVNRIIKFESHLYGIETSL